MDTPRKSDTAFEKLQAVAPDFADYLQLFVDDISIFDVKGFRKSPELARHSLPDIEEDQNAIMGEIDEALANGADKEAIIDILRTLAEEFEGKPVVLWALAPILKHLGVQVEFENKDTTEEPIRFRMPNLLSERRELNVFLLECGLIEDAKSGKGNHSKWRDEKGSPIITCSSNGKIWLKMVIKEMLANGFPLSKIEEACEALSIDFQVIKQ